MTEPGLWPGLVALVLLVQVAGMWWWMGHCIERRIERNVERAIGDLTQHVMALTMLTQDTLAAANEALEMQRQMGELQAQDRARAADGA